MTDTTDKRLAFPREIWMGDRYEHDQGMLHVRAAQDEDHDHRYVDADIYDSAEKYWRARAEAAEANCEKWRSMWEKEQSYNEELDAERDALAAKLALAVEALEKLHHAVCGETGFSECVRRDSGKVYPWPALDIADSLAQTALAQLTAAPKEGKDDE